MNWSELFQKLSEIEFGKFIWFLLPIIYAGFRSAKKEKKPAQTTEVELEAYEEYDDEYDDYENTEWKHEVYAQAIPAVERPYVSYGQKDEVIQSIVQTTIPKKVVQKTRKSFLTKDNVVNGIILSEILAKPKARR